MAKASLRHELLAPEFKDVLACEVANEWKDYTKSLCSLKESSPDQLAIFSNRTVWKEVKIHCPLLYSTLCQASNVSLNSEASKERAVNAIALLVSALIRLQNWPIWFHFLQKIVAFPLRIIQTDCVSWHVEWMKLRRPMLLNDRSLTNQDDGLGNFYKIWPSVF